MSDGKPVLEKLKGQQTRGRTTGPWVAQDQASTAKVQAANSPQMLQRSLIRYYMHYKVNRRSTPG